MTRHVAAFICLKSMLFFNHSIDSIDFAEGLTLTCSKSCSCMSESMEWILFEQMFVNLYVWGVHSGVMFQKTTVWTFHLFPLKLQQIIFLSQIRVLYTYRYEEQFDIWWVLIPRCYLIISGYFQIFVYVWNCFRTTGLIVYFWSFFLSH
jgi:hypothetical protein